MVAAGGEIQNTQAPGFQMLYLYRIAKDSLVQVLGKNSVPQKEYNLELRGVLQRMATFK